MNLVKRIFRPEYGTTATVIPKRWWQRGDRKAARLAAAVVDHDAEKGQWQFGSGPAQTHELARAGVKVHRPLDRWSYLNVDELRALLEAIGWAESEDNSYDDCGMAHEIERALQERKS